MDGSRRPLRGAITFIGTATVLIRYGGITVLTDPNFLHKGEQVRLGYGLRSTRLTEPAMDIDGLPPVDLVVLSHLHEDHFDRVAEKRLARGMPIVTTPHAADRLGSAGFIAPQPLTTWQTIDCAKGEMRLRITAMPGRHGPRLMSRLLPPVMGSMLQFETVDEVRRVSIYITGDTLVVHNIREIRARYTDIDRPPAPGRDADPRHPGHDGRRARRGDGDQGRPRSARPLPPAR